VFAFFFFLILVGEISWLRKQKRRPRVLGGSHTRGSLVSKTPPQVLLEVNWKSGSGGWAFRVYAVGPALLRPHQRLFLAPKKNKFSGRALSGAVEGALLVVAVQFSSRLEHWVSR
jgi:hypothetical protein